MAKTQTPAPEQDVLANENEQNALANENESVLVEEPQPIAETTEVNEALMNEYVTVVLPRAMAKSAQVQFVSVNGKVWNIPRGKPVTIPRYVAMMLETQQRMQEKYEADVSETWNSQSVQYLNSLDR